MASANVVELTNDNFDNEILKSDQLALVDFWAVWCGPCRAIGKTVDALAGDLDGRLKVGKLNIDDHMAIAQKYGVRSVPTMLLFKGGQVVGQMVGAYSRQKIEEELAKHW